MSLQFSTFLKMYHSTIIYCVIIQLWYWKKFLRRSGKYFLIGGGYRHNIPLKGDEAKSEASGPGFEAYEPYGNILIRAAYKF